MDRLRLIRSSYAALAMIVLGLVAAQPAAPSLGQSNSTINYFIRSAQQRADQTLMTFPLHHGTGQSHDVWFAITESSDHGYANSHGINYAPKLEAAKGTPAVQIVSVGPDGTIDFPPRSTSVRHA